MIIPETKLFLLYIDLEKAYDKVPRKKLLEELNIGCGQLFYLLLYEIDFQSGYNYRYTRSKTTGVFLFITYIDHMVKMLKEELDNDDVLGSLHILLLMDDVILLATSRNQCVRS